MVASVLLNTSYLKVQAPLDGARGFSPMEGEKHRSALQVLTQCAQAHCFPGTEYKTLGHLSEGFIFCARERT